MNLEGHTAKWQGGEGLTVETYRLNTPAAKFIPQGDAHMRADAQIKFLYYSLTDRNGVNKHNAHTHTHTHTSNTQRKITLERVS